VLRAEQIHRLREPEAFEEKKKVVVKTKAQIYREKQALMKRADLLKQKATPE